MSIYSTEITSIGNEASDMLQAGFFILFGEKVPAELKEYCYVIKTTPIHGNIIAGQSLLINEQKFAITSVGKDVQYNLGNLGHVTIKFNGLVDAELPGTIHVEEFDRLTLNIGDKIDII